MEAWLPWLTAVLTVSIPILGYLIRTWINGTKQHVDEVRNQLISHGISIAKIEGMVEVLMIALHLPSKKK